MSDDMKHAALTFTIAIAGVAILHAVYFYFRTEWPESYTSLDSRIDHQYKKNPIRTIVGFRGLPVSVVVFLTSEFTDRVHGHVLIGFFTMLALYLVLTTGRAIFDAVKPPRHPNHLFVILHHAGQICVIILFAFLGLVMHDLFGRWIPSGEDFAIALLAGSFASIMAIWTKNLMSATKLPFPTLVSELRKDIGAKQLAFARALSRNYDSSGNLECLVEAILLAEAQQRPKWFRRTENFIGKIGRTGTYGVAQILAPAPISDEKSIELLIEQLIAGASFGFDESDFAHAEIRELLFQHNPDPKHVGRITEYFYGLKEFRFKN